MRRTTRLYGNVDQKATADRAHAELCLYDQNYALSRRALASLQSPSMDGMPSNPTVENTAETHVINYVYAQKWVQQVRWTIDALTSDRYRTILELYYIKHVPDTRIMQRVGLAQTQYYQSKQDALVAFAETWLPYPSELVVTRHKY